MFKINFKSLAFELISVFEKRFIKKNTAVLSANEVVFISSYRDPEVIFLFWGKTSVSGGPGTALRLVKALLDKGVKVGVLVEAGSNLDQIENFLSAKSFNDFEWSSFEKKTKFVLTNWQSYYGYSKLRECFSKWYMFVQDLEYLFFPHGSIYLMSREPYLDNNVIKICLGAWLRENLVYSDCSSVRFPVTLINEDSCSVAERVQGTPAGNEIHILCYIKHSFRRAGALMLMQLEKLPSSINGLDVKVKVVGYKPSWFTQGRYPGHITFLGFISEGKLKQEISKSDIGVCYSVTNVSLLPYQFLALGKGFIDIENGGADIGDIKAYITYAAPSETGLVNAVSSAVTSSKFNNQSALKLPTIKDTADDFLKVLEE